MAGKLLAYDHWLLKPFTGEEANAYCRGREDASNGTATTFFAADEWLKDIYDRGYDSWFAGTLQYDCCGPAYPVGGWILYSPIALEAPDALGTYFVNDAGELLMITGGIG